MTNPGGEGTLSGWRQLLGPIFPGERTRAESKAEIEWGEQVDVPSTDPEVRRLYLKVDDDDEVPGLLALPATQPRALAVALHQTTEPQSLGVEEPFGLGGDEELRYGIELARRGYLTVGVDYPGFGRYAVDSYARGYESVSAKALRNHIALIDASLRRFGNLQVVAVGHSLGGTNALLLSAFDQRVLATVVSGALTTFQAFSERHEGNLARWSRREKYMPRIRTDYADDPARLPCDFPDLLSAIHPRKLFASYTTGDEIFPITGARTLARSAAQLYADKPEHFRALELPGGHAFPRRARLRAYDFLDEAVKL